MTLVVYILIALYVGPHASGVTVVGTDSTLEGCEAFKDFAEQEVDPVLKDDISFTCMAVGDPLFVVAHP